MPPATAEPPRLRWRPTSADDLDELAALFPRWVGLDARRLVPLWRRLLGEPAVTSTVMEDLARPAGARLQGWGFGLVVPPAWSARLALAPGAPRPEAPVVARLYGALLDGTLQLPDDRTLGALNAAGEIDFFNMHYSQRSVAFADDDVALAVLTIANEAFRTAVSGWSLRSMHFESSAATGEMIAAAGFPAVPYRAPPPALPDDRRPAYFGITRDAARRQLPGTSVRHLFDSVPPRFRFSLAQRRLLWHALFDDSDERLAARLDLSPNATKKLWRGIYERIDDTSPGFFGEAVGGADDGRRGPEKRRQVLAYVRQRTEELRPWRPGA